MITQSRLVAGSDVSAARPAGDSVHGSGVPAAFCVAEWLSLAATPTFALMALLTAFFGGGRPDLLCSAMAGASPLGGMVPMYFLMSAFHSAPWLKLISRRRNGSP